MEKWISKPWGRYRVVWANESMKIKIIEVAPLGKISLQLHKKRAETWYLLSGNGKFFLKDSSFIVNHELGWHATIGKNTMHRMENVSEAQPLVILEIQEGVCEERDIIRFADVYDRATERRRLFRGKHSDPKTKRSNNKI